MLYSYTDVLAAMLCMSVLATMTDFVVRNVMFDAMVLTRCSGLARSLMLGVSLKSASLTVMTVKVVVVSVTSTRACNFVVCEPTLCL